MRYILAAFIALVFILHAGVQPASAQTGCPFDTRMAGIFDTQMAGIYVDPAAPMRVQVFPCGGVSILWDNPYGRHQAYYLSTDYLPGGGVVMRGYQPDPKVGYLDGAYTIAVKPAEVGHIQVVTVDPYGNFVGVYRLPKWS